MKLFRDARNVSASALMAVSLSSLRSLLLLGILGPALIGAWKAAGLLHLLGEVLRTAVSRGMSLLVPMRTGQGNQEEARRLETAAGFFVLLAGLALGAGVMAFSFLIADENLRLAVRIMAVVLLFAQPCQFIRELTVARHSFQSRSKELLMAAMIDFTFAIALSAGFGLVGIGTATLLSVTVPALYLWRKEGYRFGLRPDWPRLREMSRVGMPYSLTDGAFDLTRLLDAAVMTPLLGPIGVGYYAVSLLIMDFSAFVTRIGISQVVTPHLLREFGKVGSARQVAMFYEMPTRLLSYLLPPVLGMISLLIPQFVHLVLPQYTPGIAAAQVTIWAVFFMAVHASLGSFFLAAGKQFSVLRVLAVLIPLGALAQVAVIRGGFGLTGVAWTSFTVFGLATTAELWIARRGCGHGLRDNLGFLASTYLPLVVSMAGARFLQGADFGLALGAPVEALLRSLLLVLCYLPVLAAYETRFSMLRAVRQTT